MHFWMHSVLASVSSASNLKNNDLLTDSVLGNKLMCGGHAMFEPFIEKLNLAIKEDTAPDCRRHNQKLYCSKWVSLNHMKRDVESRLGPDEVAPCDEWLAAQFTPNKSRSLLNEKMYGRIDVVRRIQKHTIVKENVDGHFSNACLKNVRKFGMLHKEHTTYIVMDDKCLMKVGSPGYPLALSSKARKVFVPSDLRFEAADHDMCMKFPLVPSLFGEVVWNENGSYALGDCHNLKVKCVLKDAAIYPSKPFQHAAELMLNYKYEHKDYMIMQADGGSDFNCSYWRTIIALLMIMNEMKLTHLIVMKNAGGLSIYNPIERAMGAVTFGSQCLALCRSEGSRELEEKLKECKGPKGFIEKYGSDENLVNNHTATRHRWHPMFFSNITSASNFD